MSNEPLAYESTTVRIESSMAGISDLCEKYGVESVRFTEDFGSSTFEVEMRMGGLPLRLRVTYGRYAETLADKHPKTKADVLSKQARRSAWRWAYWTLKLTFEGDLFGFRTKEAALLAGFIGPDGRTFEESTVGLLGSWHAGNATLGLPEPRIIEGKFSHE